MGKLYVNCKKNFKTNLVMNFILIGKGKWGKKILINLKKFGTVKKIVTSKDNFKNIDINNIDWVFIATPNKFHYTHTKFFLKNKINVFCEKPLSLTYKKSLELINLSKKFKVKLYIDDIEYYKNIKFKIKSSNYIFRSKLVNYSFIENLYALVYHDLYVLNKFLKVPDIKIKLISKKKPIYIFKIFSDNKSFTFEYNLEKKPEHLINGKSFNTSKNFISKMIKTVLLGKKTYFINNHARSLKASYLIDLIRKK